MSAIESLLHRTDLLLDLLGMDLRKTARALRGTPLYLRDLYSFWARRHNAATKIPFGTPYPCTGDRFMGSGSLSIPYFHQDLLVARRIHLNRPEVHIDVGSRIDGFVAHVASFRRIRVIDVRPLDAAIANVEFIQGDFMQPLPEDLVSCCDSLSCLHALEHFGLGRYGDPVECDGHLLGLANLHRCLQKGGTLYLSVPIGPQRIEFNAHRVFSLNYLLNLFAGRFEIKQFSYIDDGGSLYEDVPLRETDVQVNCGCRFGCGIFEMQSVDVVSREVG